MTGEGPLGIDVAQATAFGEDGDGELYVMSLNGPIFCIDPA